MPERNTTKNDDLYFYYDENAFGNWKHLQCAPFNVTEKQTWTLRLNDTRQISSFYLSLKPGGVYGGYTSYSKKKQNYSQSAIRAYVGGIECDIQNLFDYPPHNTHMSFSCNGGNSFGDFSSFTVGVNKIVLSVDPMSFDKKFDPQNLTICSLTLFHTSLNCGQPDRPLNSFVKIENQIAYYSCEDGYELKGQSILNV